jgi:hypothetical protein
MTIFLKATVQKKCFFSGDLLIYGSQKNIIKRFGLVFVCSLNILRNWWRFNAIRDFYSGKTKESK